MPRRDGTGPAGMGAMTGRGAGFCVLGYMSSGVGYGSGFGRGRWFKRMFYQTSMPGWRRYNCPAYGDAYIPAADEKEFLNSQEEFLENQLQEVKKRIKALNDETE